jgi:hypothetical protein
MLPSDRLWVLPKLLTAILALRICPWAVPVGLSLIGRQA